MRAPLSIRRFVLNRLTVAFLALALAVVAVTPGGTTPAPCPEPARTATAREPQPKSGIDLTLRVWNLRVEFPWMRSLPVTPGHHIVISLFVRALREGRRPVIFGDGHQTRDFTYVANAVRANLLALRAERPLGGAVLNVGIGRRVSLLDLVAALNRLLGIALDPEFQPSRAGAMR